MSLRLARRSLGGLLTGLSLLACPFAVSAAAAPGSPLGSEFTVATGSPGFSQVMPSVARDRQGNFVVVWADFDTYQGGARILGRRYDTQNRPLGDVFRVDAGEPASTLFPRVAMNGDGAFVVAWQGHSANDNGQHVRAQRYDRDGLPQGAPIPVESNPGLGHDPAVAIDEAGGFVVAWSAYQGGASAPPYGDHVFARRFNASGQPLGGDIWLNAPLGNSTREIAVAMNEHGDAVVVWPSQQQSPGPVDLAARRLKGGEADGPVFIINDMPGGGGIYPRVAMNAAGGFLVSWTRFTETSSTAAYRRYAADGTPLGAQKNLDGPGGNSRSTAVAMAAAGEAVVVWEGYGLHAQLLDSNGNPRGASYQAALGAEPAVAVDADGDAVLLWEVYRQVEGGQSVGDVRGRRFAGPQAVDLQLDLQGADAGIVPGAPLSLGASVLNRHPAGDDAVGLATGISAIVDFTNRLQLLTATGEDWVCGAAVAGRLRCSYQAALTAATTSAELRLGFNAAPDASSSDVVSIQIAGDQYDPGQHNDWGTAGLADRDPDPLVFPPATNVARETWVESATIRLSGTNLETPIRVTGGYYRIEGGSWTASEGIVQPGAAIQLRHFSASTAGASRTTTVNVGGRASSFVSTTTPDDTTPDAYNFIDLSGVVLREYVSSNVVTISGINQPTPISVSSDVGSVSITGTSYINGQQVVLPGARLRLHMSAANIAFYARNVTVDIGGVKDTWQVRTGALGPGVYDLLGIPKPKPKEGK